MTLERGALLHSRYRIVEILGEGGMGAVYRAVDENLGIEVAVKENFFTSDDYARQFRREANILASMRHPNLPRVTDHFVVKGQGQYLVLDFIEGEDLRERIDRLRTLPEEDVIVLGIAICDALTYLHDRTTPILHRDIKPGNVKITPNGELFLVDFGLAKIVEGTRETTPGARAMTPGYSPPEQYGTARTDRRTDIYSLGATLYEALTGAIPEDGLGRLMAQTTLVPTRKRNPEVSRKLAAAIEKALEVQPEDRYQTAEAFKLELINISKGATRRKITEAGLVVTPPPAIDLEETEVEESDHTLPDVELETPFPVSSPIVHAQPPPVLPKKKFRFTRMLIAVFLGLLIGSGTGSYFFLPELSAQAISMFNPQNGSGGSLPLNLVPGLNPDPATTTAAAAVIHSATPNSTATRMPSAVPTLAPSLTSTPNTAEVVEEPTPTLTPLPTPLGGGQGQIAFASNRLGVTQIWLINVDGSNPEQITDMPDGACQPSWSPDGERLVFISPCKLDQEIYPNASLFIINADGSDLTPLPTTLGGDYDPAWSPDGSQIVFTSLRNGNRPQVHLLNLEDYSVELLSERFTQDFQPSWSPDGRYIIFITTRKGPYQVWTMDSKGLSQELFSRSGSSRNIHPVWSPDGNVILFTQSKSSGEVPTLFAARYEEQGFTETRILPNWIPSREASFSPDGFWVAFESWPDGKNHEIYIMTPNGVDRRPLMTNPAFDFDAAWRPSPPAP